jgi:hypothetical protein
MSKAARTTAVVIPLPVEMGEVLRFLFLYL